jgi:nucleoside phosphorylase
MIIIICALALETSGILKKIKGRKIRSRHYPKLYTGSYLDKKILVVVSGTGKSNAIFAAQYLLSNFKKNGQNLFFNDKKIEKIIIAGVSGALIEDLNAGDIAICTKIVNIEFIKKSGACPPAINLKNLEGHLMPVLLDCASYRNFDIGNNKVSYLSLGTVGRIINSHKEKRYLNKTFDVQLIDMESYWFALNLLPYKIPVFCIRSILDNYGHNLPEIFKNIDFKNTLSYLKTIPFLIASPSKSKTVVETVKNFFIARKNLNLFLEYLCK